MTESNHSLTQIGPSSFDSTTRSIAVAPMEFRTVPPKHREKQNTVENPIVFETDESGSPLLMFQPVQLSLNNSSRDHTQTGC
jgi:hypothetical protein